MKNLLYICSRFPYPLEKGDKLRAFHQIKDLSKNFNIHLVSFTREDLSTENIKQLEPYTSTCRIFKTGSEFYWNIIKNGLKGTPFQLSFFQNKEAKKYVKNLVKEQNIDLCFNQLIRVADYSKDLDIPKALDYMDVLSVGVERQSKHKAFPLSLLYKIESKRLSKYEAQLAPQYNLKYIISEQDLALLPEEVIKDTSVLVNGVDDSFFEEYKSEKKYDICFVGNMSYPPNVLACKFIVNKILPILKKHKPDIKVLLAGASPVKEVKDLVNENVIISGWMDDIREAYASSSIFIAPLFIGTGLQNKLLEAMAMKTPCITTSLCNNALQALKDEEILIADNEKEFSSHILKLLNNKGFGEQMANKAQNMVRKSYNWKTLTDKLAEDLNNLI